MARSNGAWGIELGASGIKAIRLEPGTDGVTVTDFTVIRHQKVLTTPGLDIPAMVRHTLVQFVQAYSEQLGKDSVAVSVPGNQALARFVSLPPVDKKRIPEMVQYEAEQQIPFPIDEVEWDSQIFAPEGAEIVRVGIFAITKERLRETLELYAECGLFPGIVTLSPVALYNAFVYDIQGGTPSGTVALVDVGSASTDFIAAQDGSCYLRTFSVGGHQFTEAIAAAFKCAYPKAEAAKLAGATGKHAREVIRAMGGAYEQFIDEFRRSVEHYQTVNPNAEVRNVVGVGGTLRLTGLRKFVGGQVNIQIARWDEFKRIRMEGTEAADFAANTVNLATAYGLALQALGESSIKINLIPTAIARKSLWRTKVPYFAAAAALGVATGAAFFIAPFVEAGLLGSGTLPVEVSAAQDEAKKYAEDAQQLVGRIAANASTAPYRALLDDREVWPWIIADSYAALWSTNPGPALLGSDVDAINAIPAKDRRLITLEDLKGEYRFDASKGTRDIVVTLEIEFTNEGEKRFLNDTAAEWLRKHAKRDDAPYDIIIDDEKLIGAIITVGGKASAGSPDSPPGFGSTSTDGSGANAGAGFGAGSSGGSGGFGLSGNSGADSGGGNESGSASGGARDGRRKPPAGQRSGGGAGTMSGSESGGEKFPGSSDGGSVGSSGGGQQGASGAGTGAGSSGTPSAESKSLEELAPIPASPALVGPDDTWYRATITFIARLKGSAGPALAPAPEASLDGESY